MKFVKTKEACRILGLHPNTLRRYADSNQIKHIKSIGGQRLYEIEDFLGATGTTDNFETILYCRVSSSKQRDDLQRQISSLQEVYPEAEVIKDIGSGLNFKRKGLQTLLERILSGKKCRVVVAYRDRLARFGVDVFEFLIKQNGGELVVLNKPDNQSVEEEFTEDLLAVLHHFSCKMHGRRSHKSKENKGETNIKSKTDLEELVRDIKVRL